MTILSDGDVRARKRYGCDLCCGEWIEPGEVYHRQGAVNGGRVDTFCAHLHCWALSRYDFFRGNRTNDDRLSPIAELCLDDPRSWSPAHVEAACDAQGWSPCHPSRERARALWQEHHPTGAPRTIRPWWPETAPLPGTALVRL